DLDVGDLDAPAIGLGIEDGLDVQVQLFALGQHLVQFMLAQYRPQRRLRQLAGRLPVALDLDDGLAGTDHPEIQDRIHLHRHGVAGNHILRGNVERDNAHVHADRLLQERDHDDQPRPLGVRIAAQREDHGALVFAQDAKQLEQHEYQENERQQAQARIQFQKHHEGSPRETSRSGTGSTFSIRPCSARTRTDWPSFKGVSAYTCQISPRTSARALPRASDAWVTSPVMPGSSSLPPRTRPRCAWMAMIAASTRISPSSDSAQTDSEPK